MAGKITLKLSLNDDLRRLAVDPAAFSFAQLKDTIKRLYAPMAGDDLNRLVIRYLDDEEDLVTVTSDEELREAFALANDSNPPILRLYLGETDAANAESDPREESDDEDACGGCCDDSNDEDPCGGGARFVHLASFLQQAGFLPRPWWARRFEQGQHPCGQQGSPCGQQGSYGQGQPQFRRCPIFQQHEQPSETSNAYAALTRTRADGRHAHELQLSVNPYGHGHFVCDGCQLSGEGASYQCADCSFDLHVDCAKAREVANPWQRRQQWFRLHQAALQAMELHTREGLLRARELLREQAIVSAFHRLTPLYNLACVEVLLGENLERAVDYLRDAVAAGWNDLEHIKNDDDLKSLRALDSYQAIVLSLSQDQAVDDKGTSFIPVNVRSSSGEKPTSSPTSSSSSPKLVKKPDVPTSIPTPSSPKIEKKVEASSTYEKKKLEPLTEKQVPSSPQISTPSFSPAPSLATQSQDFAAKLKTLEEMGFTDRRRNIAALVFARGDIVQAVQNLFGDN